MRHSIAIDGPVGAGKSSVAGDVAAQLGFLHLDTGAMYRALGLKMLREGLDPQDERASADAGERTQVAVAFAAGGQRTLLDGEDVTELIRTAQVSAAASAVSQWGAVRARMVALQRAIAESVDMVLDGRDIGARVLPGATLKVFLTADARERAARRHAQLTAQGTDIALETVLADLLARDAQDASRAIDPVRPAPDAVLVDATELNQAQVVARILALYRQKLREEV